MERNRLGPRSEEDEAASVLALDFGLESSSRATPRGVPERTEAPLPGLDRSRGAVPRSCSMRAWLSQLSQLRGSGGRRGALAALRGLFGLCSPGQDEQSRAGGAAGAGGGAERSGPGSAHLGPGGAADGARPPPLAPSPVRAVRSGRGTADKEPGPEPSGHRGQEGAARGRGRGGGGGQRHRGAEPGRGVAEPRAALAGNKRLLLPALSAVARAPPHHGRLRAPPRPGAAAAARSLQPERCPAPPAPVSTGIPAAASPGRAAGGEAAPLGHGSRGAAPARNKAPEHPEGSRIQRDAPRQRRVCPRRCQSAERGGKKREEKKLP